jgi:hypothetical protein
MTILVVASALCVLVALSLPPLFKLLGWTRS